MATKYRFGDSSVPHFITFAVVNWIDVFSRECYKGIVVESLKFVVSGLVTEAQYYKYSSAMDYYEERSGLVPITFM